MCFPPPSPGQLVERCHEQVNLLPGVIECKAGPHGPARKTKAFYERLAAVVAGSYHDVCRLVDLLGYFVGVETIDRKGDDPDPVRGSLGAYTRTRSFFESISISRLVRSVSYRWIRSIPIAWR